MFCNGILSNVPRIYHKPRYIPFVLIIEIIWIFFSKESNKRTHTYTLSATQTIPLMIIISVHIICSFTLHFQWWPCITRCKIANKKNNQPTNQLECHMNEQILSQADNASMIESFGYISASSHGYLNCFYWSHLNYAFMSCGRFSTELKLPTVDERAYEHRSETNLDDF